jgi:hypothetical protein
MQGTSLHFRKVKSHMGIIGNQYADKLAKKAANMTIAEPGMPGTPTRRNAEKRMRPNCMYRYKRTVSAPSQLTSRQNYKYA